MSFRGKVTLLSAVALLLLVLLLTGGGVRAPRGRAAAGAGIPLVGPGVSAQVEKITIDGPETVVLRRDRESRWWIVTPDRLLPAHQTRVGEFLQHLAETCTRRRVTGSAELWPDFGLSDGRTVTLETADEAEPLRIVFGNRSERGGELFVSVGTAPDILAADDDVRFYLEREPAYWSQLRLLPPTVTPDSIWRLAVRADIDELYGAVRRFGYELRRESGDRWIVVSGVDRLTARPSRVRELLAAVASLQGTGFASRRTAPAGETVAELVVELRDGSMYSIELFRTVDGAVYEMVALGANAALDGDGRPIYFQVLDWTLERLFVPPADLTHEHGSGG